MSPIVQAVITRHPEWRLRLAALIVQHEATPFAWGTHDCGSWGADVALALTGADVLAGLRGTHRSALAAQRELQARGGLVAVLQAARLREVPPADAATGDLVAIAQIAWPVLGVCMAGQAWAPGPQGLASAELSQVGLAWRV